MKPVKLASITAGIAFLAAMGGVWIGRAIVPPRQPAESELHEVLHHRLGLDAGQRAAIAALERRFAVERRTLEHGLRADNARLAKAIETEHANGPAVAAAVDASHRTMGELQKRTLAHIFAMRQRLRPDQAAVFDQAVVSSLTAGER